MFVEYEMEGNVIMFTSLVPCYQLVFFNPSLISRDSDMDSKTSV